MKKSFFLLLLLANSICCYPFSWPSATVYFLITDRFVNGDTSNDQNYGRVNDYGDERLNAATFHGGDLKGILQKVEEGYFDSLGVDVVWMTDVYEQIHGWQPGSGSAINDFPHYGYHGYYPLDYTQMDKNYGTIAEMRQLVDALHSRGIRVMLGANINDPGYPTLFDAVQYGFAPTDGLTAEEAVAHNPNWSYEAWAQFQDWTNWWTNAWLRTPNESWDQDDKLTMTLYGLPDFKDEKTETVSLPVFLKEKWEKEGSANDAWVNPSAQHLREDKLWAPADYVIAWIASWVEEFGIDGFRCDIVEYVHGNRWRQLYEACNSALESWRKRHPENPASAWTDPFYLTGDFDNAYIDFKPDYADYGFSSMVNFYFPKHGDLDAIVPVWQMYADSIAAHPGWHSFNYLNNSYHRDAEMDNMENCLTTLLLSPGVAQLFYGDETRRDVTHSAALQNVDSDQAFRSDMDWDNIDGGLLRHCQRLGQIRSTHPVIAMGRQVTIDPHTCVRISDNDTLIIRVKPIANEPIKVSPFFSDGTILTDLYTSQQAVVGNGFVKLPSLPSQVAILVKIKEDE